MDFHLKQWRNQHESEVKEEEQQPPTKIPKLLLDPSPSSPSPATATPLPLFVPSPDSTATKLTSLSYNNYNNLSAVPTRMGSYFSLAQWQELELQALIYRYMLAGAAIPTELLNPIKKSLLLHSSSSPASASFFLQHYSNPYPPSALLQGGYWGRAAMDPEPGRCRRTDGKKWRCSRDVVAGQKYCERHVHRGRNRSRKPVEVTTAAVASSGGGGIGFNCSPAVPFGGSANRPPLAVALASGIGGGRPYPSADLLHLSQRSSGTEASNNRSDGHVLRHFFDDWPRESEDNNGAGIGSSPMHSATCLSISMPAPAASDVSLKLATGNVGGGEEEAGGGPARASERGISQAQAQMNWATGWAGNQMGGPLAEALRSSSSASNSSPTSVLSQLPRGTASETSFVSA